MTKEKFPAYDAYQRPPDTDNMTFWDNIDIRNHNRVIQKAGFDNLSKAEQKIKEQSKDQK